ncbi:MAG: OsmC family peroxiredoxin [Betaproteobacteria bacterium]|nr:MAG: OsmC family peroxiredoxin [Betaproteobacteria bacterium]
MAEMHHFSAKLTWTGAAKGGTSSYESYSRDHLIEVPGKPPLPGSADKAFRGDSSRHNPEDLLVMSLSACHMLTYLAQAARSGVQVVAYSDEASGIMQMQQGKMRFTQVSLRPQVVIAAGSDVALAERLHRQAHEHCFIANSVNFRVSCDARVSVAETV